MDRAFKARLERRFGEQLTGPIRQRHDETEMRIAAGDVVQVISALHDEPDLAFEFLADLCGVDAGERTIDVQVTRLRRKLEEDSKTPRYLQTVRGKGYLLRAQEILA